MLVSGEGIDTSEGRHRLVGLLRVTRNVIITRHHHPRFGAWFRVRVSDSEDVLPSEVRRICT